MDEQKITKLKEQLAKVKSELTEMHKDNSQLTEDRILRVLEQLNNNFNDINIKEIEDNAN
jgi:hypothetical protein